MFWKLFAGDCSVLCLGMPALSPVHRFAFFDNSTSAGTLHFSVFPPRFIDSLPARNEGDVFAFDACNAFLLPIRIACVRLCHELRASLPSRHRHLRRGAELQNRSPYRCSPPPQEHVSISATYSCGAVAELFRPEARVCMGHQVATACGAGLKAVPLPFPSRGPSRSDTDKLRSRRSCVHLSRVPISRNPAAVSGLLLLGDLFHLSPVSSFDPCSRQRRCCTNFHDAFGISRRQTVASPQNSFLAEFIRLRPRFDE
jgi:hypothetical protein